MLQRSPGLIVWANVKFLYFYVVLLVPAVCRFRTLVLPLQETFGFLGGSGGQELFYSGELNVRVNTEIDHHSSCTKYGESGCDVPYMAQQTELKTWIR